MKPQIYFRFLAIFMIALVISLPVILAEELNLIYDANGNLVSGDGFVREYNGLNQLVRVKNDSGATLETFVWHPIEEKILIKKIHNSSGDVNQRIVYVNENTVKIKNSSGTFYEHYIYQDGVLVAQRDADGNKQFIHSDHEGSNTLVTDINGNVLENSFYSPFGEILEGGKASRFDYEGKEFDDKVSDVDFHFRKYRPDWGRFTQPDTLIQNVYDPQNLNRYAFERNNAYRYTDPTGHIIPLLQGVAIGLSVTLFALSTYSILNDISKGKEVSGIQLKLFVASGVVLAISSAGLATPKVMTTAGYVTFVATEAGLTINTGLDLYQDIQETFQDDANEQSHEQIIEVVEAPKTEAKKEEPEKTDDMQKEEVVDEKAPQKQQQKEEVQKKEEKKEEKDGGGGGGSGGSLSWRQKVGQFWKDFWREKNSKSKNSKS